MSKLLLVSAILSAATAVSAQGTQCGPNLDPCPERAPCCSEYGFCGSDEAFCLGGCNPWWSNALDSCRAMPICQEKIYTFPPNSARIVNATLYDGNSTKYDWTIDEGIALNTNRDGGELALIYTEDDRAPKGTRISSTTYVHYGTITARVRTGKWNGVVTAFITMSNVKDEIDWEWPGATVNEAQSNFFFQGHVDYATGSNGAFHRELDDTFANYHDYTIDWQPETLRFLIDGQEVRSVNKADTMLEGKLQYPTTPARIQLSLWGAGTPDFPQGTVDWAGGMIQFDEPDYVANGNQYQALVSKVTVECNDELPITANTISYVWGRNDTSGIPTVQASNQTTLLDGAATMTDVKSWMIAITAIGALALLSW